MARGRRGYRTNLVRRYLRTQETPRYKRQAPRPSKLDHWDVPTDKFSNDSSRTRRQVGGRRPGSRRGC